MKSVAVSQTSSSPSSSDRPSFPATLSWPQNAVTTPVFLDSGADENFIDRDFVKTHNIPVSPLPGPKRVDALDGRLISNVTLITAPLTLQLSGNHSEQIRFFCYPLTSLPSHFGSSLV